MMQVIKLHRVVSIQASEPLMAAVYALRREVFVVAPHIPRELEMNEDDKIATLVVAQLGGRVHRCVAH
jgi:hypothetical protein